MKVVSTFPAGGPVDVIARLVTNQLANKLHGTFVVENRPGAGGTTGARSVSIAPANGYTLLFASQANLISGAMYNNLDYDPVKGFTAIASVSNSSWLLVVSSKLPVRTLDEFIVYAKQNPGKLNFGFGLGSAPHLLGELFKVRAGINFTSIPYKGGGGATTDLLSGEIHLTFGTASTLLPFIQDGRLRPLAVTSSARWPELPTIPTMAEKGFGDIPSEAWTGLLGPPNLPPAIVKRLNVAIGEIVQADKTKASMTKLGYEPNLATPAQFADFLMRDMDKWRAAVKVANIKVD